MAFALKNNKNVRKGQEYVPGKVHRSQNIATLPQTTTQIIFKVIGGRVLVHLLIGEVTTAIASSDPVLKVSAKKLNAALDTAVGTAYDIASTLDLSSDEVGSIYTVEGDGTALVSPQLAGAGYVASTKWIAPNGEIYVTTGASKTGGIKWDIWYEPLDEGAYVEPVSTATAVI